MASSDDEGEALPDTVSNYYFVNDKDEPISFSELPVQWNGNEGLDGKRQQIFLHGTTDNGLQKIYKQVTAWKFDLSDAKPEVMVFSKDNNWIKLQKPRKSFEDTIRTILITVHCLHLAKKNPEISERSLWDHLSKVFSLYETKPRRNDLIDHMKLIGEAVKVDEMLAKSKFLVTFLEEKPQKEVLDEDIGSTTKDWFFVDDDMIDEIEDDGSDEDEDLFDSVCAICDNGGDILCCEGRCMRSFHATKEAGSESGCVSLGLSNEQVEAIQNFFCKNCQYKQHQCFACGELGSSDKLSGTEVYKCVSATCGHFYHPHCVAKLLHRESAAEAEELQKKIAAGESFTCPIHKCIVCKQGENKMDPDLQFAVCRRCPKSYHRKCLPRKIVFEGEDEGIIERAWEGLIPNRILIYCLKHEIDDELRTPVRNHIKFPDDGKKRKKLASEQLSSKEKVLRKERNLTAEDVPRKRILGKAQEDVDWSSIFTEDDSSKKIVRRSIGPESSKMQKAGDKSRKPLNNAASRKLTKSTADEKKPSLGEMLYNFMSKGSESVKSKKDDGPDSEHKQPQTEKSVAKAVSNSLPLDDDSKKRILALVKDASSSITLEKIIERHKLPTTHAYSSKNVVDRTITLGKVEGSVEAVRAALKKIEEGSSIEDAKAVCEPEVLNQIIKWKNKLKVYLAPFLYGMRYTSFGRHFTKVDKLKEIVDRLHYYVQDGDMIVDFCCGANDFSWLMKQKLDEIGTRCSYKNYDVLQAKNDFNFEKRDWFSVYPKELPTGSQLIMGLNPPFGVNAALANKFIDKALEFKPKLVILIVPEETERLDKKVPPYDLVWEDDELLSGKSFYLPGSVDVNDNQLEDWNVNTPPLYLWSRSDWTGKHKAIAQQHGHLSRVREQSHLEAPFETPISNNPIDVHDRDDRTGKHKAIAQQHGHLSKVREQSHLEAPCETPISNNPIDVHDRDDQTSKSVDDPLQNAHERLKERGASVAERKKKDVPCINGYREVNESRRHDKNHPETSKKRRRGKGKRGIGTGEKTSTEGKEKGRSSASEMNERMPLHSPPNVTSGRSMDRRSFEPIEAPSHSNEGHRRFEPSVSRSRSHFETGCDESHQTDDIARRFSLNVVEPYSGGTHGWSSGPTTDYGVRNSEERFPGYQSTDARGYRASYISEMDERHARESALRSQVPVYGQQPYSDSFNQRSSYFPVGEPGFSSSYNQMGPAADSSYSRMNTSSTMQRYAPRLDELNHTRMNTYRAEPPLASRNGIPDPLATPPGYRVDSLGFAPGPSRPYSQQNSSGWLNE